MTALVSLLILFFVLMFLGSAMAWLADRDIKDRKDQDGRI